MGDFMMTGIDDIRKILIAATHDEGAQEMIFGVDTALSAVTWPCRELERPRLIFVLQYLLGSRPRRTLFPTDARETGFIIMLSCPSPI